jgi:Flp pilus assembly protein TadD
MPDRLAQLAQMHEADPADADLPYMIAMEHVKAERWADAIEWFDRTLRADPHYCYAFYQKAKALSQLGRDDEARDVIASGMDTAKQSGNDKALGELAELREAM